MAYYAVVCNPVNVPQSRHGAWQQDSVVSTLDRHDKSRCFVQDPLLFENPDAVANQFLAVADQLVAGMEADIQVREQRLRTTKTAQGRVAAKAQELKLEQRLYRDRAKELDTAQTDETTALQDAVTALQNLGKPQVPPVTTP